jgi:predicted dehydrogenase
MKVLIIGLGSIGKRHVEALKKLRPNCTVLALRSRENASVQDGITNIYRWEDIPDGLSFVIISNPTSEHYTAISQCIPLNVPLFVEKPPLMSLNGAKELIETVHKNKIQTYTAFNMRFHPVLQWLKEELPLDKVLEVAAYCGSYLPDWRTGTDYRSTYSARRELGGGVHLDLTHELDYIKWLFGAPQEVYAYTSKVSDLEIDSVDYAHYHLAYKSYNASISLNYYRRKPRRNLEIVLKDQTWEADLLQNKVVNDNGEVLFHENENRQLMYERQMQYFLSKVENGQPLMNNLQESVDTLSIALPQRKTHA